jgi:hypothetical protein
VKPRIEPAVRDPFAMPMKSVSLTPTSPEDYARGKMTDTTERAIDCARLAEIEADHRMSRRPQTHGAADTVGWDRYGFADGSGRSALGVGRDAAPKNRDPRP